MINHLIKKIKGREHLLVAALIRTVFSTSMDMSVVKRDEFYLYMLLFVCGRLPLEYTSLQSSSVFRVAVSLDVKM